MNSSSPQSLLLAGIALTGISFKLKADYIYLYYISIIIGIVLFVIGIIKYIQQRNRYKDL